MAAITRVRQVPLTGTEITVPTLGTIRGMIDNQLAMNNALESIKIWVQYTRGDCEVDTKALAQRLGVQNPQSKTFRGPGPQLLASQWSGTDTNLARSEPVVVKGAAEYIGGDSPNCRFQKGFHAVLFFAHGVDNNGDEFYVVLDRDNTATQAAKAAWDPLVPNNEPQDSTQANQNAVITALVTGGTAGTVSGLLFRRYYFDKSVPFPAIKF